MSNVYVQLNDSVALNVTRPDAIWTNMNVAYKEPVVAATTANITLSGTQTVDGVSLSSGNRVLVKDQTIASENGVYEVAAGTWSRVDDINVIDASGISIYVTGGDVNTGYLYFCNSISGSDRVGTDSLSFGAVSPINTGKDYLIGSIDTTDQLINTSSEVVIFNNVNASSGISLATDTGLITLNSDKTYVINTSFHVDSFTSTNGYLSFKWVTNANINLISNEGNIIMYNTSRNVNDDYHGSSACGSIIYNTYGSNSTFIRLIRNSALGSADLNAGECVVSIFEI